MDLKQKIRDIPDFPKAGILFKDITTLLKDGPAFRYAIDQLAEACKDLKIDLVAGPEARGFVIGSALAYRLGVGLVPIRKSGKLPAKTRKGSYALEYGKDTLEIHEDAVTPGQRVLVVDDLLATGGTIKASVDLVEELGGTVVGAAFFIELTFLDGREKLKDYNVISLIQY
jgi:adenine phosphoribosyltransferase